MKLIDKDIINRLKSLHPNIFSYDKVGNILKEYTFNDLNQLTKVITKDNTTNTILKTLSFTYDPVNRRYSKTTTINNTSTYHRYLYDAIDIIAILDKNNNILSTITHSENIDQPLSITTNNNTYYYLRDVQGSIISLVDKNNNVVEEYSYDAYGKIISSNKTIETNNPYGYTARVMDDEDLYYYRARYYDPTVQRFLSLDPIGFGSLDFNFYRYVGNNPLNFVNPFGLKKTNNNSVWLKVCKDYSMPNQRLKDMSNTVKPAVTFYSGYSKITGKGKGSSSVTSSLNKVLDSRVNAICPDKDKNNKCDNNE